MVKFPDDWGSHEPLFALFDSQRVPVAENDRPLGRTPYYGANGVQGYIDGSTHQGEYVLVAEDGASDLSDYPVRFVSGNIWVNNHAHVLSGIETVSDTKYLSYAFKLVDFTSILVGGTRTKLNGKTLKEITFPVPQVPEQRAIAQVLSGFDEHLKNLDELIAKKKNIRDGALDALLSGKKRMFGFQNPFLRAQLLEYSEVLTGLTYTPSDVRTSGVLVLRSSNIQDDVISLEDTVFVRPSAATSPSVQTGDVLLCVRNGSTRLIGKTAQINENVPRGTTFGAFMAILRALPVIYPSYLYWFTKSSVFREQVREVLGATINQITKRDLASFTISLPESIAEQKAIADLLSSVDEEIRVLKAERSKIEALKLGAMDDLLTGRVRLPVEEEAA